MKLDVSSLKDGMSSLKDEVSSLKDAVYSLKDEVDTLKDMVRQFIFILYLFSLMPSPDADRPYEGDQLLAHYS